MSSVAVPILDKSLTTPVAADCGTITIRVVVFRKREKKGQDDKKSDQKLKVEEAPLDIDEDEDFGGGSSEVNTYLEQPKRGKMCIVFTLNGQRHDGMDNSFIVNELRMKYLRKRMIIAVDLDGLSREATSEIIQGSRSGLYKGTVYDRIHKRLVATLLKDPELLALEQEAEDELAQLETGNAVVQHALDELITNHFSGGDHAIDGLGENGHKGGPFFKGDGTMITSTVVALGENGVRDELPVLVSNRQSQAIRLKPNKTVSILLRSDPIEEWSALSQFNISIEPPISGLSHEYSVTKDSAEISLTFQEPESFSSDEYPLEAVMAALGVFNGKKEPRLLEKEIEIRSSVASRRHSKPRELKDQPTYIRVATRQPIRVYADGTDTHVRLTWDGKDYLTYEPSPEWTFSAVCTSHEDFPGLTFTKPTNGRFSVLVHTPEIFLVGTKLEFTIHAAGPNNSRLESTFSAIVVEHPTPRKLETAINYNGQRRPPYILKSVTEKDWESATRWGEDTWNETHAGSFSEPKDDEPLILCINEDFGQYRALIADQIKEKKDEQRTEEKKTRYIAHVAFHLYQMYLSKQEISKRKKENEDSDINIPADEEMQQEINRVASTLINLTRVMR